MPRQGPHMTQRHAFVLIYRSSPATLVASLKNRLGHQQFALASDTSF
jgi:hypothetical protein